MKKIAIIEGYAVLRAYSGTEALYLLSQNKPDLVLLDLMLPGLSGEELRGKWFWRGLGSMLVMSVAFIWLSYSSIGKLVCRSGF